MTLGTPQRVPFVQQLFLSTKTAISLSVHAIWSLIITLFLQANMCFFATSPAPSFLGPILLFSSSCSGMPFYFCCLHAKAHLLHILACLLHIFGHERDFFLSLAEFLRRSHFSNKCQSWRSPACVHCSLLHFSPVCGFSMPIVKHSSPVCEDTVCRAVSRFSFIFHQ